MKEEGMPIDPASRAALGALAGLVGTFAITAAMRRLHARLPRQERYPLPPREIVESITGRGRADETATRTQLAHFAYGALTGAICAVALRRAGLVQGALFGAGVWCASYLGWLPLVGVLKPANEHPARRNALMLAVHLLWGVVTAFSLQELIKAQHGPFAAGSLRDVQDEHSLLVKLKKR
jgi:hypothetical protein